MSKKTKFFAMALIVVVACAVCFIACKKEKTPSSENSVAMNDTGKSGVAESNGMKFVRVYAHCDDVQGGFTFNENGELVSDEHADMGVFKTFEGEMTSKIDNVKIGNHFPNFVKTFHKTDDYLITCFETHFLEVGEMIQIEYVLNHDFSNPESAMYVLSEIADTKDIQKPVLIKCNGSCNTSSEKCQEVFNYSTNEVHCGCQSDDCSMIIQPVD